MNILFIRNNVEPLWGSFEKTSFILRVKTRATDILSLRDKEIINEPKPFDLSLSAAAEDRGLGLYFSHYLVQI